MHYYLNVLKNLSDFMIKKVRQAQQSIEFKIDISFLKK